ncbi:hypothetical protein MBBA_0871 [Methanoculleus bourgensis]|nr:hypothetical protein MBBA_0871 [Methanoculleus bourgensis]
MIGAGTERRDRWRPRHYLISGWARGSAPEVAAGGRRVLIEHWRRDCWNEQAMRKAPGCRTK